MGGKNLDAAADKADELALDDEDFALDEGTAVDENAELGTEAANANDELRVAIAGPGPLRMYVHIPPGPVGARAFGVRVVSLRYDAG